MLSIYKNSAELNVIDDELDDKSLQTNTQDLNSESHKIQLLFIRKGL